MAIDNESTIMIWIGNRSMKTTIDVIPFFEVTK